MKYIIFILVFISLENAGHSANILAMMPHPLYSHIISFTPIFKALAARGHNVTVVSSFPQKPPVPNLTDIVVPNLNSTLAGKLPAKVLDMGSLSFQAIGVWEFGQSMARAALSNVEIKKLIEDENSKFDLIMTEIHFLNDPLVAFGHKFNAPVISLLSSFFYPRAAYLSGNPWQLSYMPSIMYFSFNDRMTFIERVQNTLFYYWDLLTSHLIYLKQQDAIMREHFVYPGSENLPSLEDLLRNISLTLVEYDMAVGYPVPLQKNIIPLAGVNLMTADKLPDDLQNYMDASDDGVIYFSMGSFLNISTLEPQMIDALLSAMNKLEHNVIMKLTDDDMINRLKNNNRIQIRSWLPQRSILAHPNCKLFITHCGIHSVTEGVYHAVPMVGIPLQCDQTFYAKVIETLGIGVALDFYTLSEEKLLNAINEVLSNSSYQDNVNKRSDILRDIPMDTMDNAIYWIEYVIRHKGAPHLRPAVLDLHWYQYLMLDVIAFYLLIIIIVLYMFILLMKLLFTFFLSLVNSFNLNLYKCKVL